MIVHCGANYDKREQECPLGLAGGTATWVFESRLWQERN